MSAGWWEVVRVGAAILALKAYMILVLVLSFQKSDFREEYSEFLYLPDGVSRKERLSEIRATIAERGAACVFREPQFEPALIDLVIEGSGARQGELDPEAASLAEGPELYFEMMRGLARSIAGCLGESS